MQERVKPRKKAVNLSIDAALVDEAKAVGCNLSAILEGALRERLRAERRQRWFEANKEAIEASNRELEANGMWYTPEWLKE